MWERKRWVGNSRRRSDPGKQGLNKSFPEQAKDDEVAMLRMNIRAPQLNHLRAQRLEDLRE